MTENQPDEGLVEAVLFNQGGKYKYTVILDYRDQTAEDYEHWDLREQARKALRRATERHVSRVTFTEVPDGWSLVVMTPRSQNSRPVMVRGGLAALSQALG